MLRYLLKNILNYGKSYIIIFTLMIIMSLTLSFFIALGRAYSNRAVEYSRAMGDLDIYYTVFDEAEIITTASEIMEFSENVLQAEKTIGVQGDGGILFSERFSKQVVLTPLDIMQEFDIFQLIDGTLPDDYSILVPRSFAEDNEIVVGDHATFVYDNMDGIVDSIVLTVSGIYALGDDNFRSSIVANKKTHTEFFGEQEDWAFTVYLSDEQRGGEHVLLSDHQFDEFNDTFTKEFGDDVGMNHSAKYYYDKIQLYLFFFYFLILIMIGILSLLAVSTIMNITHTIFANRLPDVGVFFSFGFSVKKIAVLFAAELLCLFVLATSIGLGISHGISQYISTIVILPTNWTLKILLAGSHGLSFLYDAPTYVMTILCCVILPFIFSYIYMRKKSGKSVVTFLRNI